MSRAGLTIVSFVPWAPDQLPNFYHAVLTFERLNVGRCSVGLNVTSTKKVVIFLGEEMHPERKSSVRAWEKGPALCWYGPPAPNG